MKDNENRNEMWKIKHESFARNYGNDVMTYEEAKFANLHLGLKTKKDYTEFWEMFQPNYLPPNPEEYYS